MGLTTVQRDCDACDTHTYSIVLVLDTDSTVHMKVQTVLPCASQLCP